MTPEFETAMRRVIRDVKLDGGGGASLTAVGIRRDDCLAFLEMFFDEDAVAGSERGSNGVRDARQVHGRHRRLDRASPLAIDGPATRPTSHKPSDRPT